MSLVVDRERPPLAPVRAVVDQRDQRRRDELAHVAREHRCVLVDVVGLEPVPARLVEQHAAGTAAQHHGDLAGRRGNRVEQAQRARRRRAPDFLRLHRVEQLEAHRAAGRLVAGLHAGVAGRDALHHHPRAHLVVVGEQAVGVGNLDAAVRVGVRRGDRRDRAWPCSRAAASARREQLDLARLLDRLGRDEVVAPARGGRRPARARLCARRRHRRAPRPPPRRSRPRGLRASGRAVCAKPVVSPRTTRSPAPRSRPETSSSTRPSSNRALDERRSSTNTSAKSPPPRNARSSVACSTSWSIIR